MSPPTIDRLFPYVVPASYVDWVEPGMWISWPVSKDVSIALVFDGDGIVRNTRPEELDTLGLDETQAFDRAAENLTYAYWGHNFDLGVSELLDGTQLGCAQGSWMAPAAGLMFRNFFEKMEEHFGVSEFVGIALNQELLVAFPPDDKTLASAALKAFVEERFGNHRKPISRSWLLLDGEWPRAFPGKQAF